MKTILSFFLIAFTVFFLLQIGGREYVAYQASQGEWIESAFSKLELLKSRGKKDFIVVGSSTTLNEFDTLVMEEEGLSFFNMGLPGVHWQDYPVLLKDVASSPLSETIVLQLSPMLLMRKLECPGLDDIRKVFSLRDWDCLSKFSPIDVLPFNHELKFIRVGISNQEAFQEVLKQPGVLGPDESRIHYLRGQGPKRVFILKEGDGLIVSPDKIRFPEADGKNTPIVTVPEENQDYIVSLASLVLKQSKKLIIIIEPRWPVYTPNFSLVPPPGVTLIPNHELRIHESLWVDINHLNREGVKLYSRLVACQLKGLNDCKPIRDKLTKGL